MHISERPQLFSFLQNYAEKYEKNLTIEKLESWWKYLQKYSIDEVIRAFDNHASDERKHSSWASIAQIEFIINKDLGHRGHQHVYSCQMTDFEYPNRQCGRASIANMGTRDKTCFVCHDHYEFHRVKSDIDIEVDRRAVVFEAETKAHGMTNRQYFFHLRGKNVEPVTSKEVEEIENREIMKSIFSAYEKRNKKKDPGGGAQI